MNRATMPADLNVVMFSQKVDQQDWLQGFTVDWIRALAAQVHQLDVIALEMRGAELPANVTVHSLGKEQGANRLQAFAHFQHQIRRLAPGADIFFGHLTPRYTWLAAPIAGLYRVPQALWYTHNHAGPELRMAIGCARWITTAVADSFPIPGPKVHALGHGIDSIRFTPGLAHPGGGADGPPLVLAVGRIARIKHHHILLEAAARLRDSGVEARFAVAGSPATSDGEAYQRELEARITALHMEGRFTLVGPLRGEALVNALRGAAVVTNLSPAGLFDKAALEAMMVGRPVLVTNPAFDGLLGPHVSLLRASAPDALEPITAQLTAILTLSPAERDRMGADLRARAVSEHSLDRLMQRMVALWRAG
jgi:glycosyltransferase involved in cell wall biosynthesis